MSKKLLALSFIALLTAGSASAADLAKEEKAKAEPELKAPSFFLFSDTQVGYRYQSYAASPGNQVLQSDGSFRSRFAPKQILNISHADAWEYGTNFLSVDVLKAGSQLPAGTTNGPGGSIIFEPYGYTDVFGVYRGTLSLNAITGTKSFAVPGIIKDVSLSYGTNFGATNDAFGSKTRAILGGLNFSADVPAGFLNLSIHAYKEWNRNGFNLQPDRDQSFNTVPEIEITYNYPLTFTGLPLALVGFESIILPKGRGISSNLGAYAFNPSRGIEFLSRTNLVLDLGKLLYDQPNKVDVFIGFQYWLNKFGNNETPTFKGTEEKSFLAGVSFHAF